MPPKTTGWYTKWHKQVNASNQKYLGKGLPIQSLGIVSKIREVDTYVRHHQTAKINFLEAHPEVCFQQLNNGKGLLFSKKELEGQQERIALLKKYFNLLEIKDTIQESLEKFPKTKALADDVLDAICLAVHAKIGHQQGFISLGNEYDEQGVLMAISYSKIE